MNTSTPKKSSSNKKSAAAAAAAAGDEVDSACACEKGTSAAKKRTRTPSRKVMEAEAVEIGAGEEESPMKRVKGKAGGAVVKVEETVGEEEDMFQ